MPKYAKGKYAFGYSDRSGFRYPISELVPETMEGRPTGIVVGYDEVDPEHPQESLGRYHQTLPDVLPLRNPRPDLAQEDSRRMWSWDPVGNQGLSGGNLILTASVGTVTIS